MVTVDDVRRAYGRIRESLYLSPCSHSETFSELSGNQIFLKLENLQMTGAYKERGALKNGIAD
jgi:threonine dehydratase